MQNIFDRIGAGVFDTIAKTFGYSAQWQPGGTGTALTAIVGYGEPVEDLTHATGRYQSVIDEWQYQNYWAEYKLGDFPGLFESVRAGNAESITIFSTEYPAGREFPISQAMAVHDGRTYKLKLLTPLS